MNSLFKKITETFVVFIVGVNSLVFAAEPDAVTPSLFDSSLIKNTAITPADYEGLLRFVLEQTAELRLNNDGEVRAGIQSNFQSLRRQIPDSYAFTVWISYGDPDSVRAFDTTAVTNNDWLLNDLDKLIGDNLQEGELDKIQRNVDAALHSVSILKNYILIRDTTDYRNQFMAILERPEFQEKKNKNLLLDGFNWLMDQLASIFSGLFKNSSSRETPPDPEPRDYSMIGQMLVYAGYVIGAMILLWLAVHVIRHFRQRKEHSAAKKNNFENLIEPGESMEPDDHLRHAHRCAFTGEYRKAIRHMFLSIILHLDAQDHFRYQKFQTNGEYLTALLNESQLFCRIELHGHLKKISDMFEKTWYGIENATEEDFTACNSYYHLCLHALQQKQTVAGEV
ncbi:hypothetical protein JNL27_13820 [bacterium]|nr:hypothetical protein [bacterium]